MPLHLVLIVPALLAMAGIFHITPQLTRPDLFFSVTTPPDFRRSPEGQQIMKRYRLIVWGTSLAAIALVLVFGVPLFAVLLPGLGFWGAFLSARRQAMAHAAAPDPVIEVELNAPEERLPGGWVVAILPILALAAVGVWASFHMDQIPRRMAVHWGFHGPDRWVDATPAAVFGFLAVHASTSLLLIGMAWGLLHASRRIATSGPSAEAERRFRKRMVAMCIVMAYLMGVPVAVVLLMPSAPDMTIWFLALTAVIVFFTVTLFQLGQGGSRLASTTRTTPMGDRTSDVFWKLGVLYINPADPAILVEKRFGIGYTVNFGNRWSWVALAAVAVPAALGMVFLR